MPLSVRLDESLCVGHGRCYALAPDVFGADDFGHAVVLVAEVEDRLADQARTAADNCPERAITVADA
ncbi:MAG: ferredoxin [Actinomycetota bacterium]